MFDVMNEIADNSFFITSMPVSRPADYYIGYMDGCVYLDFNSGALGNILLIRISFDGYGCCELGNRSLPLDSVDSQLFKSMMHNDIKDPNAFGSIIRKAISLNAGHIWQDALEEYGLV